MAGPEALLKFPKTIEVFLPLVDGVHPIVPADLNEMARVLNDLQDVLGYGTSPAYASGTGPKGNNANVAERLSVFMDASGSLNDVAFLTIETQASSLNENIGFFVPFGKQLTSTDYRVILQVYSTATQDGSGGVTQPHLTTPGFLWVGVKSRTGFTLFGRTMDGFKIGTGTSTPIVIFVLAFGAGSTP